LNIKRATTRSSDDFSLKFVRSTNYLAGVAGVAVAESAAVESAAVESVVAVESAAESTCAVVSAVASVLAVLLTQDANEIAATATNIKTNFFISLLF